jgi:hypothetical protein
MANTAKNRLFSEDLGFYNTQGKTMLMLKVAFHIQAEKALENYE